MGITAPSRCALAIAGLDPSAGAGLFADLRAFAAAGAWGCGAVSVLTVQSTARLLVSRPVPARLLAAQVREILSSQNVRAIKIGALGSDDNVRAMRRILEPLARTMPVVIDPVMLPTVGRRGARLLDARATHSLRSLAALPCIVTPNAREAEALVGARVATIAEAASAARTLVGRGARAALVKGGHLGGSEAVDVLVIGGDTFYLRAPRLRARVHGTGCTLSSLIAGRLAMGQKMPDAKNILAAIRWAKKRLTRSISEAVRVGVGQRVLRVPPVPRLVS
jgi:hydroxymethylpyrimidine kinase/phosphomethylpyrimidine kinase